jgi:hypothetical protein
MVAALILFIELLWPMCCVTNAVQTGTDLRGPRRAVTSKRTQPESSSVKTRKAKRYFESLISLAPCQYSCQSQYEFQLTRQIPTSPPGQKGPLTRRRHPLRPGASLQQPYNRREPFLPTVRSVISSFKKLTLMYGES